MTRPEFHFFISDDNRPVTRCDSAWEHPLPRQRHAEDGIESSDDRVCLGEYFSAIQSFLSLDDYQPVFSALNRTFGNERSNEALRDIRVFLMKHGQYYHAARINVLFGDSAYTFVVNAAASPAGISVIDAEIESLNRLNRIFPYSYVPNVFARGDIRLEHGRMLRMFLGEWFDGYKEFHLSPGPGGTPMRIVVWNDEEGGYFLKASAVENLYSKIAALLTAYYNVATYEHIALWHHAAGDFILKQDGGNLSLKLISVRNYRPMLENAAHDIGTMLDALLIFLLQMSIRTRLDRADGVGDLEWAQQWAVAGTLDGFFQGLKVQADHGLVPEAFIDAFKHYIFCFELSDLLEWASGIVNRIHPDAHEKRIIRAHIQDHVYHLHAGLKRCLFR
ncbi:MAG: hypothetical protein R6U50_17615 [Desulfobacterales bacterium]